MPKLSDAGKRALDDLVKRTVEGGRLPGFVVAVSTTDEQVYANAGGNLVYGDPNSPAVTIDSIFWICSMTKFLAGIAALQLIEQGKLSFDTPVSKYFPEFENPIVLQDPYTNPNPTWKPAEQTVTILHLLTHSSGLYYGLGHEEGPIYQLSKGYVFDYDQDENKYTRFFEHYKGKYPGIPLAFEPGSSFIYGFSSDVLGFVVEKITGQTLGDYSKKNIFEPLGVKNTYDLTPELKERLVELCFRNPDDTVSLWADRLPVVPRYPKPANLHFGGIGSFATFPDYLTILRHLLQIEAGRDVPNPIMKRETVKSLFLPKLHAAAAQALSFFIQIVDPGKTDTNWSTALAVTTTDWEGRRKAGSGFWSGWAGTWYVIDPTTGVALVAGSQIVPPMDKGTQELFEEAERIVYANLED